MTLEFDLEKEIATAPEQAERQVEDTRTEAASALKQALGASLQSGKQKVSPKAVALVKRAVRLLDGSDASAAQAARLCLDALDIAPEFAIANNVMGMALERLGRLSKALEFYERAWKIDPSNPQIYMNLGMTAWKLNMLEAAEKFLKIFHQMNPDETAGVLNVAGVMRDQGRFEDSVEILRAAIYAAPDNAILWNALGTTLFESGDSQQAVTFYEEALRLRPDFSRVHHNIAFALETLGRIEDALKHYEFATENAASEADLVISNHAYSQALLSAGRLRQGWDLYRWRLNRHYPHATNFLLQAAPWEGDDSEELKGRTIVLMGEQGLGDEVLFANVFQDVIDAAGAKGEVRIACERRLVPLFQRSFPDAVVERHYTIEREGRKHRHAPSLFEDGKVDLWTPYASPLKAFRATTDAFPDKPGYLIPDEGRVEAFRRQLMALGPGPKVGLLWKSLKMDASRSKGFAAFEMWKPVLKTPGVTFLNLQYGDVAEELEMAESRFGVKIHQPEDIDLMNDLDGVAAFCKACDLVIGPMNATTNIAAAAGGKVWFIRPNLTTWAMLGETEMLWYPGSRTFAGDQYRDWVSAMKKTAAEFSRFAAGFAKAA